LTWAGSRVVTVTDPGDAAPVAPPRVAANACAATARPGVTFTPSTVTGDTVAAPFAAALTDNTPPGTGAAADVTATVAEPA